MKTTGSIVQILLLISNEIRDNPSEKKIEDLSKFLLDLIKIVVNDPPQWLIEYADQFIIL